VVFAVDEEGRLIDDIRVRRFLLSPLDRPVSELLDGNYATLSPTDDREKALQLFQKFDRVALPVTDDARKLIGIVTVDDMLDVQEEEATEDIQKMGAVEALDEPYLAATLGEMVKKRATWLVVLFVGELFTATAMRHYQSEIDRATILAVFLPLIISSGDNSGSQASTLIIRALAVGELALSDWWTVVRKEFFSGVLLGGILGVIGFLRIELWAMFMPDYGEHHLRLALTVALSLVGVVLWGTMSGSMLPLILRRVGLDPASSSAPFVATLVDVTGLVIYFNMATVLLRGTML
jgi:magnesium transporter